MQILLGRQGHYLQGDGEINALFSGIKGAQTPPPPPWGASTERERRIHVTNNRQCSKFTSIRAPVGLSNGQNRKIITPDDQSQRRSALRP